MRKIRYQVAMSLDGYIAGPDGEYDWIPMDPEVDFQEIFARFDTLLMGRKTFLPMASGDLDPAFQEKQIFVISQTMRPEEHADVNILGKGWSQRIGQLKKEPGKDIWLFGGGQLFRSCLEENLVDSVEVAVIPILLGNGIPMYPTPATMTSLRLRSQRVYQATGIVLLDYDVLPRS